MFTTHIVPFISVALSNPDSQESIDRNINKFEDRYYVLNGFSSLQHTRPMTHTTSGTCRSTPGDPGETPPNGPYAFENCYKSSATTDMTLLKETRLAILSECCQRVLLELVTFFALDDNARRWQCWP